MSGAPRVAHAPHPSRARRVCLFEPVLEEPLGGGFALRVPSVELDASGRVRAATFELWNGACLHPDRFDPAREALRARFAAKAHGVAPEVDPAAVAAKVVDFYQRLPAAVAAQRRASRPAPPAAAGAATGATAAAGDAAGNAEGDADPEEEVEWREEAPLVLSRPLELLAGRAYAVTYVHVTRRRRWSVDGTGRRVHHDPPQETTTREVVVVRGDGAVFGPGAEPSDDLEVAVRLRSEPLERRLLRPAAVRAYQAGARPDAAGVFARVAAVFDHFLDFDRSLADQRTMAEFSACLVLLTWLAPAFDVLPYAWPNGGWGSGKTKWLTCWALAGHMGEVTTMAATLSTVRDLAELGAALGFDDAERLVDPKRAADAGVQEKRELFLAGNRKGVTIPLKEPAPDGGWRTVRVPVYCPRAFTSIGTPDPVLRSRSVPIPLVRTPDPAKGNAEPSDPETWPVDPAALQDDLWALALALLPEAAATWRALGAERSVVGRTFQVWRAPLTVARLLEQHGVAGLEGRVRGVMRRVLREGAEAPDSDRTTQVVRAIVAHAFPASRGPLRDGDPLDPALLALPAPAPGPTASDVSDVSDVFPAGVEAAVRFTPQHLVEALTELSEGEAGGAPEWANARSVGWVLSRLRIEPRRDPHTRRRARFRELPLRAVADLALAHGLVDLPDAEPDPGGAPAAAADACGGPPAQKTSETSETSETSDRMPAPPTAIPTAADLGGPRPADRAGPCQEPGCPHPGIPAGDLGDGRLRCAEHHLAWRRGRDAETEEAEDARGAVDDDRARRLVAAAREARERALQAGEPDPGLTRDDCLGALSRHVPAAELDELLDRLVERGVFVREEVPAGPRGGRRSVIHRLSPAVVNRHPPAGVRDCEKTAPYLGQNGTLGVSSREKTSAEAEPPRSAEVFSQSRTQNGVVPAQLALDGVGGAEPVPAPGTPDGPAGVARHPEAPPDRPRVGDLGFPLDASGALQSEAPVAVAAVVSSDQPGAPGWSFTTDDPTTRTAFPVACWLPLAEAEAQGLWAPAVPDGAVLVTTAEALAAELPALLAAPALGLDTETTGLDPLADRLRLVQLATAGPERRTVLIDAFACPLEPLRPLFAAPDGPVLVAHNLKFDLQFLHRAGLPLPDGARLCCTLLAAQVLDRGEHLHERGYFTLEALASRVVGVDLDKTEQTSDWGAPRLSTAQLAYAARDAGVLVPLHRALEAALAAADPTGGLTATARLEMGALPVVAWTELAGVPFDPEAWGALAREAEAALPALREAITEHARSLGEDWLDAVVPYTDAQVAPTKTGKPRKLPERAFNPGSQPQQRRLLEALGVRVPNVQEATLAAVRGRHPVVEDLLRLKAVEKKATTFGVDYLQHVHPATGRIHASYVQLGSEAGRMSCRDPNVQQVPHEGAYRACFRAGAGRVLVRCDYQQIELAVVAELAGDRRMLGALAGGDDLHRLTAASLYGVPPEAVTPEQRAFAKSVNFGSLFGQGAGGLVRQAGAQGIALSAGQARAFLARFDRAWPALAAWRRARLGSREPVLRTVGGRQRVLAPDARATFRLNTPVQGTAADGFKAALGALWATRGRCPSGAPVLLVHDELVVECDEAEAQEAVAWVQEAMVAGMTRYVQRAPVRVEATVSRSWGGPPLSTPAATAPARGGAAYEPAAAR